MENSIFNKIVEIIKSGKPPTDWESIDKLTVKTKNFTNNFNKVLLKIASAREGNYEIITFVGKRGYGKTHLLNYIKCYESNLEKINENNKNKGAVIIYHPTFLDSDLALFYQTVSSIGKEGLISFINNNFPNMNDEEIFNLFLENRLEPITSALIAGLKSKKKDIVNRCFMALTGNYDLSQNPIKLKFVTLNKNIEEENVFNCFKTLSYLITKYENRCLIIEFDELQEYLKEDEGNPERLNTLARRIHKYINENIRNCIIIFSFTDDAYENLINDVYSNKLGLKNKIENTKMEFHPLNIDEREELVNKLIDLFEKSRYMKDLNATVPESKRKEISSKLQNLGSVEPRSIIKNVIYELMHFWEEISYVKEIFRKMDEKGGKFYEENKNSIRNLGDILHKSLYEFFNNVPELKPVEKEVEIKDICNEFIKNFFPDVRRYEKSLDLLLTYKGYKIGVSIGYSNEETVPLSKVIPIAAFAYNDLNLNRGLLIVSGFKKFGIKNGSYKIFTKIEDLKTAIHIIYLENENIKKIFSFSSDLENKIDAAKIMFNYLNIQYILDDLIYRKTPIYQVFKE